MSLEALRERLSYQGLLLGTVALVCVAALAVAARLTHEDIAAAEARDLERSLAQVLPGDHDNALLDDRVQLPGPHGEVTVYRARRAGRVQAVVFQVIGKGYAGPIVCVMGVDRDGQVLGVRVLAHKETPGLGDKIELAKGDWILAFAGRSLRDPPPQAWAVKKDGGVFDQFTGATITPRAVVQAVRAGLEFFARERARLLDETGPGGGA